MVGDGIVHPVNQLIDGGRRFGFFVKVVKIYRLAVGSETAQQEQLVIEIDGLVGLGQIRSFGATEKRTGRIAEPIHFYQGQIFGESGRDLQSSHLDSETKMCPQVLPYVLHHSPLDQNLIIRIASTQ